MKNILYLLILTFVFCGNLHAKESGSFKEIITKYGLDGIKEHLKDPDSAKFRSLSIHPDGDPKNQSYFLCGEVNSKNSFGGYSGYNPFSILVLYFKEKNTAISSSSTSAIYDGNSNLLDLISKNCRS